MSGLSYEQSGVNYDRLDAFKRACQKSAASTTDALQQHGLSEPAGIRGESAYLIETPDEYLAHVEEGLGTKNLIADAMQKLGRRGFYRNVGIDTVATMVNDLITVGATPISIAMHAAVGDAEWFADEQRANDLADGFAEGCRQANAVWGGGETPTLRGIVNPDTIVLAGSALGRIRPKSRASPAMCAMEMRSFPCLFRRSNQWADPLPNARRPSAARAISRRFPVMVELTARSLLDPSVIYVRFILRLAGSRADSALCGSCYGPWPAKAHAACRTFRLPHHSLPKPPPIFRFIQEHGPVSDREAYATFNMGVGFAVYVDPAQADACLKIAKETGYTAWHAGTIYKEREQKAVVLNSLGITFDGDTLQVR